MSKVWLIAIAGGSGSGKTTLAKKIKSGLRDQGCAMIGQDSYYIDQSSKFDRDGGSVNFDHPDALDFALMAEHLKDLREGKKIEIPIYDFAQHKRLPTTQSLASHPVILVDGTLILSQPALMSLFDESLFLEVDEETRFKRRLRRDVNDRGRTPEGVKEQFYRQVKVMHDEFVEPSKAQASFLVRHHQFTIQKKGCSDFQDTLLKILNKILT